MRKFTKALLAGSSLALILIAPALAIPFSGASSGAFSALSNCGAGNCEINNGGSGANTRLEWGYNTFLGNNLHNGSQLTANPLAIAGNSTQLGINVAELTWNNQATSSNITDPNFNVNYTMTVTFATPPGSVGDTETFSLNILNTINPPGDNIAGLTLAHLSNLSFALPGITVSNFQYAVDGGTTFNPITSTWTNPEENTGHLFVRADFRTTPVAEPASLAILGMSLLGLGMVRRKRPVLVA